MKKAEKILVSLAVIGLIMRLLHLQIGGILLILSVTALASFYFLFSFIFLNNITLKEISKKNVMKEVSAKRFVGAIAVGYCLSIILIGFLFRIMLWPFAQTLLYVGLLHLGIVSLIALFFFIKNRSVYFTKIFIRIITVGGFGLIGFLTPYSSIVDYFVSDDPEYAELLKSAYNDPHNEEKNNRLLEYRNRKGAMSVDDELNTRVNRKYSENFQSIIDSIFSVHPNSNGIMVHVENENISWSGAVGYSDHLSTPLQKDQPILIASNTKTYVSAAILRLVEEKKLSLNQSIKTLISQKSQELFEAVDYDLEEIKIIHLLSHTSGIDDYVNDDYIVAVSKNQKHRWTRDEQILLATTVGKKIGSPEFKFKYADVNYLLLTEIIETATGKEFQIAIRDLLKFEEYGMDKTWFKSLDEVPVNTKPLAHQYFGELNWDSYEIDPSFDLYGGGGLAATSEDMTRFIHLLFNNKIIEDENVLNQIYTKIETQDSTQVNYSLGLSDSEIQGMQAYGHGGFWGTAVQHFPEINTTISVFILERDERKLRKDVLEAFCSEFK